MKAMGGRGGGGGGVYHAGGTQTIELYQQHLLPASRFSKEYAPQTFWIQLLSVGKKKKIPV